MMIGKRLGEGPVSSAYEFIGSRQLAAPSASKPVIRSRIFDGKRQWLCGFREAYISQRVKDGYVVVASTPERAYQAWCKGTGLSKDAPQEGK